MLQGQLQSPLCALLQQHRQIFLCLLTLCLWGQIQVSFDGHLDGTEALDSRSLSIIDRSTGREFLAPDPDGWKPEERHAGNFRTTRALLGLLDTGPIVVSNVDNACHTTSPQLPITLGDGVPCVVVPRLTDAYTASRHDPAAALLSFHLHNPLIAGVIDRILLLVERPGLLTCSGVDPALFIPVMGDKAFPFNPDPLVRPIDELLTSQKVRRGLGCSCGELCECDLLWLGLTPWPDLGSGTPFHNCRWLVARED